MKLYLCVYHFHDHFYNKKEQSISVSQLLMYMPILVSKRKGAVTKEMKHKQFIKFIVKFTKQDLDKSYTSATLHKTVDLENEDTNMQ